MDWLLLQLGTARESVSSFLHRLPVTLFTSFPLRPNRDNLPDFYRYEGGPGDGQWDGNTGDYGGNGDNGDGSGTIVYVQSGAALDQLSITMVAGVCFLAIALIL